MRLFQDQDPESQTKGVTLVELLFAMSLVSLIAVFLITMLDAASQIWRDNEERAGSYREARAALTFMMQELSSIHAEEFPGRQSFIINPEITAVRQTDITMDEEWANRLFFLTTVPGNGQSPEANRSDVCAVGYFLAYTADRTVFPENETQNTARSYKLYRYFRSSDPTFQILCGNDQVTPLFEGSPAVKAEVLAIGITRFTVKAYVAGANGLIAWNAATDTPRPDIIELSLTAIGSRNSAQLRSKKEWEDHNSLFHRKNERTFTSRVHLRSLSTAKPTS